MFVIKEIVWGKTKGYPWWPAEISKIPSPDHNYFKVCFIGENNHALLQPKAIRKYLQYYNDLKNKKFRGLQNSIDLANSQIQKRKINVINCQYNVKIDLKAEEKIKKIKKRGKKKSKLKKELQKNKLSKLSNDDDVGSQNKINCQKISSLQNQQKEEAVKQIQSLSQSICLSEISQEKFHEVNEFQYIRNVDRKKIDATEQQLFSHISRFNSSNYEKQKECFEAVLGIQHQEFKAQEILQSKITNMLSYIYKKLSQKTPMTLKKEQIQKINNLSMRLKQKVTDFLFDCCYYDQYLKRMQKNVSILNTGKQEKDQKIVRPYNKKPRKYKRKNFIKKKEVNQHLK